MLRHAAHLSSDDLAALNTAAIRQGGLRAPLRRRLQGGDVERKRVPDRHGRRHGRWTPLLEPGRDIAHHPVGHAGPEAQRPDRGAIPENQRGHREHRARRHQGHAHHGHGGRPRDHDKRLEAVACAIGRHQRGDARGALRGDADDGGAGRLAQVGNQVGASGSSGMLTLECAEDGSWISLRGTAFWSEHSDAWASMVQIPGYASGSDWYIDTGLTVLKAPGKAKRFDGVGWQCTADTVQPTYINNLCIIVAASGKVYLGEWSKNQGTTQFIAVPNGGRMSMGIGY